MKTITVTQPWAFLLCFGIKDIENRTWKTSFRGRVLIHSSARQEKFGSARLFFGDKKYNALSDYLKIEENLNKYCDNGAIIGSVEIVDCVQNHTSVWAEHGEGVYNWVIANPVLFEQPIEGVKGRLSFWNYELPEEPKHAPTHNRIHVSVNLDGLLRNYGRRSLKGFFLDSKGREMSDAQCRKYIAKCQAKGWKKIPACDDSECPNFDHYDKGCPGHRITKEECERRSE